MGINISIALLSSNIDFIGRYLILKLFDVFNESFIVENIFLFRHYNYQMIKPYNKRNIRFIHHKKNCKYTSITCIGLLLCKSYSL